MFARFAPLALLLAAPLAMAGKPYTELSPKKQIKLLAEGHGYNVEGNGSLATFPGTSAPIQYRVFYGTGSGKWSKRLSGESYQFITDTSLSTLRGQLERRGIDLLEVEVLADNAVYTDTDFKLKRDQWDGVKTRATGTKEVYRSLLGAMGHITKLHNNGAFEDYAWFGAEAFVGQCRVTSKPERDLSGAAKNDVVPCGGEIIVLSDGAAYGGGDQGYFYPAMAAQFGVVYPDFDVSSLPTEDQDYARGALQLLYLRHELALMYLELHGGR